MGSTIKVAVVGASGYSGEELVRLLIRHPGCEIAVITSRQYAGQSLGDVFSKFQHVRGIRFEEPDVSKIASSAQAAFLALPHGHAAEFAEPLMASGVKVLDLSADFRIKSPAVFAQYYKEEHPAPALLPKAVYGLPERYRGQIKDAGLVACAGCYPTSVILAAAPLLAAGIVSMDNIVVSSASGVSGAGRKVDLPYIFPECNESFRAYSPVGHRHLPEIEQELTAAAGVGEVRINFIPHLAPLNRGIATTIVLTLRQGADAAAVGKIYEDAYGKEPFVRLLKPGACADTKNVTMSNFCEIGFSHDKRLGKLIVTSAIDNLTKGAAGQAVQCMNLQFGFEETTGLL